MMVLQDRMPGDQGPTDRVQPVLTPHSARSLPHSSAEDCGVQSSTTLPKLYYLLLGVPFGPVHLCWSGLAPDFSPPVCQGAGKFYTQY